MKKTFDVCINDIGICFSLAMCIPGFLGIGLNDEPVISVWETPTHPVSNRYMYAALEFCCKVC